MKGRSLREPARATPNDCTAARLGSGVSHDRHHGRDRQWHGGRHTIANVARVGRARAHLQAGRKPQAAADADAVPAGFTFSFGYVDDLAQRTRLGNRLWQFTLDRGSISIAPAYRVTDPRVKYKAPGQHTLTPQDGSTGPFWIQDKYPAFITPIRVASKLEADYIKAETQGPVEQLVLINARRAANGQAVYAGAVDANSVLTELMNQKALDFYLEGRRLGDFRRLPTNVTNMPTPARRTSSRASRRSRMAPATRCRSLRPTTTRTSVS